MDFQRTMLNWYPFALLLGHANSAINPLLYCVMTKNLRKTVRKLFRQEFDDIHTGRRRCFKVSLHSFSVIPPEILN